MRRTRFDETKADAVTAFCVSHGSAYHGSVVRRLVCDLTSDPAGVLLWADDAGLAVVATVVDRTQNGADAANLEILGARAPLDADAIWRLVVEPGVSFAARGSRRALHVTLSPSLIADLPAAERALATRGLEPVYTSFEMRRAAEAPLPEAPPLPPGWGWASLANGTLSDEAVRAAHRALGEIFAGSPSFGLSPLPEFRRGVVAGGDLWRLLLDGQRLAGLTRLTPLDGNAGKIGVVGRLPEYRGRGLGSWLLAEGLRVLAEHGARQVALDVDADNDRALDLYRRFGFEVATRTPVWGLALRAGGTSPRA